MECTRDNDKGVIICKDQQNGNIMVQDDYWDKSQEMDWEDGRRYCRSLNLGGYKNWRLPKIEEIYEVVQNIRIKKIDNSNIRNYWTSTPTKAWLEYYVLSKWAGSMSMSVLLAFQSSDSVICVRDMK